MFKLHWVSVPCISSLQYMKMMGVNSSSHFFAWFIECATFLLITITFLIVVLKIGNVLPKINVVILFLYLTDYSLSIIAMCYFISVFFNNTNIAALVGCLVYILSFFPFIVLLVVENHMSFSVKSLLVSPFLVLRGWRILQLDCHFSWAWNTYTVLFLCHSVVVYILYKACLML